MAIGTPDGRVLRRGAQLQIRLLDGRTAVLKDDTTAGLQFALPRYAGYLREIHSHLVHRIHYEGAGVYLVLDDSTGDTTIVVGKPVVSPDRTRFALTSMEDMEGGNPGLIEVWRMVGRKPEKEFSHDTETEEWEASDPVWRDSVSVDFMKNTHSSPGDPYIQTPGRLVRVGSTWSLVPVPR